MAIDPIKITNEIRQTYIRYLTSTFRLKDSKLRELFHQEAEKFKFTNGPIIEATPPFKRGCYLRNLIDEGLISEKLYELTYPRWEEGKKKNPLYKLQDNPLFLHQEKAIRKVLNGRNLVIASGTSSGKTECFLIPIYNYLLREYEVGKLNPGVRAILIYPMNALANDQLRRLREISKVMQVRLPDLSITFGRYVGDTPETKEEGIEKFKYMHLREEPVKNELLSREEMRENPPHILITNYAMLEYLLIRPEDSPFFDGEYARNWKFLILDEAHIYSGAMGIEMAMLIRRLKDRVCKNMRGDIQCIATSATLVRDEEDFQKVAEFATNLFGETFEWNKKDEARQDIIKGERIAISFKQKYHNYPLNMYNKLADFTKCSDNSICNFEKICKEFNIPEEIIQTVKEKSENNPKKFLYELLSSEEKIIKLRNFLEDGSKHLEECIKQVIGRDNYTKEERESILRLIDLAVYVHYDEDVLPLLPARYHLFVRAPEGIFVSFYPQPKIYLERREITENGFPIFELASCRRCGQEYLVGNIDENGKLKHTLPETDLPRKNKYFLLIRDDISVKEDEDQEVAIPEELAKKSTSFKLCVKCGSIWNANEKSKCSCSFEPNSTRKLLEIMPKDDVLNKCFICGLKSTDIVREFIFQQDAPAAVLVTALYQNLDKNNKIISFSDSRQDAAFFAPYLEFTYKRIIFRRLMFEALNNNRSIHDYRLNSLCDDVLHIANKKNIFEPGMDDKEKKTEVWKWILQDFCGLWDRRNSIEGVGLMSFLPILPHNWEPIEDLLKQPWNLKKEEAIVLYQILLNTLRFNFAITFPATVDPKDEFFAPRNKDYKFRGESSDKSKGIFSFIPSYKGKENARLEYLIKLYKHITGKNNCYEECRNILSKIWEDLRDKWTGSTIYQGSDPKEGVYYKLDYRYWRIIQESENSSWFVCDACGAISPLNVRGVCPTFNCKGNLHLIDNQKIRELENNHYRHLYTKLIPIKLTSHEHTAQLTSDHASKIQKCFIDGTINVLSCSTTFELGVDLGELEAIFLRNVPPEPSNYIQRVGRAGRRLDTISFTLTFSQLRSHDLTYFKDPKKMVEGRIKSPAVDLSNEKIIARHIGSVVLAEFFKLNKEYYGTVKNFFRFDTPNDSGTKKIRDYLNLNPNTILISLKRIIPQPMQAIFDLDNWKWTDDIIGVNGRLILADDVIRNEYSQIKQYYKLKEEEWKSATDQKIRSRINRDMEWASKRIEEIEKRHIIDFLASHTVIPKYGFPVDVVALEIISKNIEKAKEIELQRDLKMAIAEFAPTSQVVANGFVWRTYGLKLVKDKTWPLYWYAICPQCNRFIIKVAKLGESRPQIQCNVHGIISDIKIFVTPIFGFVTSKDDELSRPGESRPPREFTTRPYFFEYRDPEEKKFSIGQFKINCKYSKNGELAVVCKGKRGVGFWICFSCGAAFSKRPKNRNHKTPFGLDCNNSQIRGPLHLGHKFKTDVLSILFKDPMKTPYDLEFWYSLLYAILEGASEALGIRRQDLDGCLFPTDGSMALILFDSVPGGAGHVKRLIEENNLNETLEATLNRVKNCTCGQETSCYGCLRNYQNQFCHELLSRGKVLDYLQPHLH